jgi:hypothetical protein
MLDFELLSDGLNEMRSELGPLVSNNILGDPKMNKKFFIQKISIQCLLSSLWESLSYCNKIR